MQEAIADAAIVEALEETVEEAVEDAAAVEAMSDAAIVGELADEVESIAADVEQAEASETEPAAEAEPAAETEPAAEAEPPRSRAGRKRARRRRMLDRPMGPAEEPGEGGAGSVQGSRRLVRRAHLRGVREQGQDQPGVAHPHDADGGQDLRRPHPDGRRHGDQGRQEAGRAAQGLPRLPPREDDLRQRLLVRGPQHARRDGVRRGGHRAASRRRSRVARWRRSCR